jgi:hypothetical protein
MVLSEVNTPGLLITIAHLGSSKETSPYEQYGWMIFGNGSDSEYATIIQVGFVASELRISAPNR